MIGTSQTCAESVGPHRLWMDTTGESALECVLILAFGVAPFAALSWQVIRVAARYLDLLAWSIASPWP